MENNISSLRWDDVEVRFSVLSHKTFKASPCGFLLPMTPGNKDEMLAKFRPKGAFGVYSGLWISGITDLSFLQEFPDLRYLEVVDQKRVDTRQLECLRNLRGLRIDSPGAGIVCEESVIVQTYCIASLPPTSETVFVRSHARFEVDQGDEPS